MENKERKFEERSIEKTKIGLALPEYRPEYQIEDQIGNKFLDYDDQNSVISKEKNDLVFSPSDINKAKENLNQDNTVEYREKAVKMVEGIKKGIFSFGNSIYKLAKTGSKYIEKGAINTIQIGLKTNDAFKSGWDKYNQFCEDKMAQPVNNFVEKSVSKISEGATNLKEGVVDNANHTYMIAQTGIEMGSWLCSEGIDKAKSHIEDTKDAIVDTKDRTVSSMKTVANNILTFFGDKKRQIEQIKNRYVTNLENQKENYNLKVEEIKSGLAIKIIDISQGYIDKKVQSTKIKSSLWSVFNDIKESYGWKNEEVIEQENLKWFELKVAKKDQKEVVA